MITSPLFKENNVNDICVSLQSGQRSFASQQLNHDFGRGAFTPPTMRSNNSVGDIRSTEEFGDNMTDFENRIKSILVDPGPEFLKNIQALAETIIFCRDRKKGCGQRDDAYQMLFIWYKYFPDWALRLFGRFVYEGVGSWADVKYLCGYLASIRCEDSFVSTCVENFTNALIDRMNTQIESDRLQWDLTIADYLEKRDIIFREGIDVSLLGGLPKRPRALETISMAVKWVPRESSKYRWLFEKMVLRWGRKYHANYFVKLDGDAVGVFSDSNAELEFTQWNHQKRVLNKLSMMYRKMVASLTREIVYDLTSLPRHTL